MRLLIYDDDGDDTTNIADDIVGTDTDNNDNDMTMVLLTVMK